MIRVKTYGLFEGVKNWKREEDVGKRMSLKIVERLAAFAQVEHDFVHL